MEKINWKDSLFVAIPLASYIALSIIKPKQVTYQPPAQQPTSPGETTPSPTPSIPSEAQPFVDAALKIEQIDSMTGPQAVETLLEVSRTLVASYNNLLMIALNKTINRINADNQAYPTEDLKNQVISTITNMINRIVVRV
jgi:hypothetical protein